MQRVTYVQFYAAKGVMLMEEAGLQWVCEVLFCKGSNVS